MFKWFRWIYRRQWMVMWGWGIAPQAVLTTFWFGSDWSLEMFHRVGPFENEQEATQFAGELRAKS